MKRSASNAVRKATSLVGVLLIALWILVPALHRVGHGSDHGHSSSSCATCQVALHGAADCVGDVPRVSPLAENGIDLHPVLRSQISRAPDVRAHGPQGPPSV